MARKRANQIKKSSNRLPPEQQFMLSGPEAVCVHCRFIRDDHGLKDKCLFSPTTFKGMTRREYDELVVTQWGDKEYGP